MFAALISLPLADEGASPVIAGKTVCQRQVDFALRCGCDLIVLHGRGATTEAVELRHQTENAGVRLQVVTNSHALVGVIGDQDRLLVLQPGLLPQSRSALERLNGDAILLTVAAGPGTRAGFERIDLDRAWAGAMIFPGSALARLDLLPEDSAPAPALLRIALQQRLPEERLTDSLLDAGDWQIVSTQQVALAHEQRWLRKVLGEGRRGAGSQAISRAALRLFGVKVAGEKRAKLGTTLLFVLLIGGSLAAGWSGSPVIGFVLLGLAVPVAEFTIGLARLEVAPFGKVRYWPLLRRVCDASLVACGVLAIDSFWYRESFAPLVIGASLLLLDRRSDHALAEPFRDRGFVALLAALGIALLQPEPALILIALAILAANFAPEAGKGG